MAELKKKDFIDGGVLNTASAGPYAGKTRIEIVNIKIKKGLPFIKGKSAGGSKFYGKHFESAKKGKPNLNNYPYELTYSKSKTSKEFLTDNITAFFKDEDFGGGGSRAKQADNTGPTESGCAYYCSLIFNVVKKELTKSHCTTANLREASKYVKASSSLTHFLKNGPEDWHEDNVYMNTANAVYKKFKSKLTGTVYCHRKSPFMDKLYEVFKEAKKLDEKEDKLAPGSFSPDKWNPGDIWLTNFSPEEEPLKNCRNLPQLKRCVLEYAGASKKSKKTVLLAISLKKPGSTKKAGIKEFNTADRTNYLEGEVSYDGFSFGKTGDFFSSNDIYLYMGGKEVQFRAFNTTTGWQGNIIGTGALGGKIGGGNIDFYLKVAKLKSIMYNGSEKTTGLLKKDDYELLFNLYKKYYKKQKNKPPVDLITEYSQFEKERKKKSQHFAWQKLMGMNLIDRLESAQKKKADVVATEIIRYAASNTDLSSYFIKIL